MTEAEVLKSALKKVEAQQENLGGFMDRFDIPEHWAVRKALKKQIAKKVIVERKCYALSKTGKKDYVCNYLCPQCRSLVRLDAFFCHRCGQNLDWSEV